MSGMIIKRIKEICSNSYFIDDLTIYSVGSFCSLNETDRSFLFNQLYILTQRGFAQIPSSGLKQDTWNHVSDAKLLYLVSEEEEIVAYSLFNIYRCKDKSILYLSGTMIDPEFQGKGISSTVLGFVAARFQPDYIAARTQNPIMYGSFHKACKKAYPAFHTSDGNPQDIKTIGSFIAKDILKMEVYNRDKMVGIGTYGYCLYGEYPSHSDKILDESFKENVNLDRGDSSILVGIISTGW